MTTTVDGSALDTLSPGHVTIDHEDIFEAAHIPDFRWNGFACPLFTRTQAEAVVNWANRAAEEFPDSATFAWEGDNLFEFCDYGNGTELTLINPRRWHGTYLYPIADGWAWDDDVTPPDSPALPR